MRYHVVMIAGNDSEVTAVKFVSVNQLKYCYYPLNSCSSSLFLLLLPHSFSSFLPPLLLLSFLLSFLLLSFLPNSSFPSSLTPLFLQICSSCWMGQDNKCILCESQRRLLRLINIVKFELHIVRKCHYYD